MEGLLLELHDGAVRFANNGGGTGGVVEKRELTEMSVGALRVLLHALTALGGVQFTSRDEVADVANLAFGDNGVAGLVLLDLEGVAHLTDLVRIKGTEDRNAGDGLHVLLTMLLMGVDDDVGEGVAIQLPNLALGRGGNVSGTGGVVQQRELSENLSGGDGLENLLGAVDLQPALKGTGLDDEHEVTIVALGDRLVVGGEVHLDQSKKNRLHLVLAEGVEEPARAQQLVEAFQLIIRLGVDRRSEGLLLVELAVGFGRDGSAVALVVFFRRVGRQLGFEGSFHLFVVLVTFVTFFFFGRNDFLFVRDLILGHHEHGLTEGLVLLGEGGDVTASSGSAALLTEPGVAELEGVLGHLSEKACHQVFEHGGNVVGDVLLFVLRDLEGADRGGHLEMN